MDTVLIPTERVRHSIPVDYDWVMKLRQSLVSSGQLSPIIVHANTYNVVDGFHRIEAIQQLGWDSILCTIVECTQEEFLDARITSAVLHQSVTFSRVVEWTQDAFLRSQWAQRIGIAEAFLVERAMEYRHGRIHQRLSTFALSEEEKHELRQWIRAKSSVWGLSPDSISQMLELASVISPSLIPMVRKRKSSREPIVTTAMLKNIAKYVDDHALQETLVNKAIAERLNEDEFREFLTRYFHTESSEIRADLLQTSWSEVVKREKAERDNTPPQSQEERQRSIMQVQATLIISGIRNLVDILEREVIIDPNTRDFISQEFTPLLIAIAAFKGDDNTPLLRHMQERVDSQAEDITRLQQEIGVLQRNLSALQEVKRIARQISTDELNRRDD